MSLLTNKSFQSNIEIKRVLGVTEKWSEGFLYLIRLLQEATGDILYGVETRCSVGPEEGGGNDDSEWSKSFRSSYGPRVP